VIVGGVAYVANVGGKIFAVDVATGTQLWMQLGGPYPSDMTISHGILFVGTGSGGDTTYAYDAATGTERWHLQTLSPMGAPLVVGSSVYVGDAGGELYALRASDGW
jgi:outer membrane protein assembly factor BamB